MLFYNSFVVDVFFNRFEKKTYLIVYQRKQKLEPQNFSIQQLTSSTIYLLIDENKTSHEIRQLIINFE